MSNVIEFPLARSRRIRRDKRIKVGFTQSQLAALDAETLRRGCSRAVVLGDLLDSLIEDKRQARR